MIRSVTLAIENLVGRFMFQPLVCGAPIAASSSPQAASVFDDMSLLVCCTQTEDIAFEEAFEASA
jgi:hypothetical protein